MWSINWFTVQELLYVFAGLQLGNPIRYSNLIELAVNVILLKHADVTLNKFQKIESNFLNYCSYKNHDVNWKSN